MTIESEPRRDFGPHRPIVWPARCFKAHKQIVQKEAGERSSHSSTGRIVRSRMTTCRAAVRVALYQRCASQLSDGSKIEHPSLVRNSLARWRPSSAYERFDRARFDGLSDARRHGQVGDRRREERESVVDDRMALR